MYITKNIGLIVRRYLGDESGATAIEYALIAVIVGVGIIVSTQSLRTAVVNAANFVAAAVASA